MPSTYLLISVKHHGKDGLTVLYIRPLFILFPHALPLCFEAALVKYSALKYSSCLCPR